MRSLFVMTLLAACQDYGVNEVPDGGETATLAVEPMSIDFGIRDEGETASASFTVTNLGPASASLEGLDLLYSTAFTIADPPQGVLSDGETVEVFVDYVATNVEDLGAAVVHSTASNADVMVTMSGAARVPRLVVEPDPLEFVSIAGEPVTHSATIRNEGLAPLRVDVEYVEGDNFVAQTDTPYELQPGDAVDVPITWRPEQIGTDDGLLWVQSNGGDATVALHGEWNVCYDIAEAWDYGWLELSYDVSGSHTLYNDGPNDVCMTHWMPFFTDISQDAALGDPSLDGDSERIVIAAGDSRRFDYGIDSPDTVWFCVEQTQVTTPTTDFWFFGARAPEPLRGDMAALGDDAQIEVWNEIATNPVVLVGRERSAFELSSGESVQVAVEAMNLGRVDGEAQIVETVPAWLTVVDAGEATKTTQKDGTTKLTWNSVPLAAAVDTASEADPAIYDRHYLSYTVRLETCLASRNIADVPRAVWVDGSLAERHSEGSPLVINCEK